MVQPKSPAQAIATRRRDIEADMQRLRDQIGAAHSALECYREELTELEVAERVWSRLAPAAALHDAGHVPFSQGATERKPAGIPTVPEMIVAALADARARGTSGLEPKGMAAFIAKRWWPDVKITDVGPIAWRMWKKQGVLENDGGTYLLPQSRSNELHLETTERSAATEPMAA